MRAARDGAACAPMSIEPLVDVGDAVGILRCVRLLQQARPLPVGAEHELDAGSPARRAPPAPPNRCGSSVAR